ncbi:MAG: NAD-dependent epimerase/dehydratase family protein [Anaerolineae bacterium]|nr:NAD-dependent epimerase/dehydratase family protein [Anaerolineae bacterium]
MRILVTGGAGFIGSHVVDAYLAAGHEVAVVDNLSLVGGGRREYVPPQARLYEIDIRSEALNEVFAQFQPEVVNHHAAQASVKISMDDPVYDAEVNVVGLIKVLRACSQYQVRHFIYISSAATYGTPLELPLKETSPQNPESAYGITKLAGELYTRMWHDSYGLDYTIFRYANVYGPRQDPMGEAGVIAIFSHRMLSGEPVRIDWDGEQSKDYVYVGDIARANLLALERGRNQVYCLGTGRPTSVNQLYESLAGIVGARPPIIRAPKRPGDVRLSYFDTARAQELLGWQAEVDLTRGLQETVAYFRQVLEQAARS